MSIENLKAGLQQLLLQKATAKMARPQKTAQFLKQAGFTEQQIDIFIALTRNGPQKVSEIAQRTGMYRMQAYRQLKDLEKAGTVFLTFESPRRFAAIPIEKLMNATIAELELKIRSVEVEKKEIIKEIEDSVDTLAKTDQFAITQGIKNIQKFVRDLRGRAKREICSANTLENYGFAHISGLHEDVISGKAKYKYKCLTQITDIKDPKSDLFLKNVYPTKNTEIRHIERKIVPFPSVAIMDGQEVVLITTAQNPFQARNYSSMSALWTNNATIVDLIQGRFDDLWREAVDAKPEIEKRLSMKLNGFEKNAL